MDHLHPAWVEVDLGAIRHNVGQVRSRIAANVGLMAVVKADAYGHGLVETARAVIDASANALAVTRLDEAGRLREAGIDAPVLVFDSVQPEAAKDAIALGVEATVCAPDLVAALGSAGRAAGVDARVHLKIDTGMGRLGVPPADAPALAGTIASTEGIVLAGTYTHLATAGERELSRADNQLREFRAALKAIVNAGVNPGTVHAANSAATLRLPDSHFDMVRVGTLLYGQYPSRHVPRLLQLKDTWQLKARIGFVKKVPAGSAIGYGAEFVTRRKSRIAVISLGWADGLTLMPESLARRSLVRLVAASVRREPALWVTVRGQRAPVVGRIAMQMCTVDVTDVSDVSAGDEVTVPARRVTVSPLIPRVYVAR